MFVNQKDNHQTSPTGRLVLKLEHKMLLAKGDTEKNEKDKERNTFHCESTGKKIVYPMYHYYSGPTSAIFRYLCFP